MINQSENIEDSDAIKVIENQVTTLNQLDFSSDEEENSTKTLKSRTKKYKKKNTQKLIYSGKSYIIFTHNSKLLLKQLIQLINIMYLQLFFSHNKW